MNLFTKSDPLPQISADVWNCFAGGRQTFKFTESCRRFEIFQYNLQDLVWRQMICVDDYMRVFAGMRETAGLFFVIFFPPVEFSSGRRD